MIDFARFTHLTFDCYGTLIDWETGILDALHSVLDRHGLAADDVQLLQLYSRHEAEQEAGPYKQYRQVLSNVMAGLAADLGFTPTLADLDALPASVGAWPPFSDSTAGLACLGMRYKLVVLSNIDDDLFAASNRRLQGRFDTVITAQQVGSYKPAPGHFQTALRRLNATPREILHVAQSLYHDHAPAKEFGFTTVRIDRPSRLPGVGLAPPTDAAPDLVLPDLESLAALACG